VWPVSLAQMWIPYLTTFTFKNQLFVISLNFQGQKLLKTPYLNKSPPRNLTCQGLSSNTKRMPQLFFS
jgi:hypothetical protein